MKHRYLLIVNECYYPGWGAEDWIATFKTYEKAEEYWQQKYVDKDEHKMKNYTIVDLEEYKGF